MPSHFIHLHTHSHYSLLEALPKVKDLLKRVKELGMDTVALTDNGVMYGAVEFYQKAVGEGIKPIIGLDAYLAPHGMADRRPRIDSKPFRLVFLAETDLGYKNLMKISTAGFLEGFYYKPRVDKQYLRTICGAGDHGLIALSGGFHGEIPTLLRNGQKEQAKKAAAEFGEMFGLDRFYLELLDRPEFPDVQAVNAQIITLSKEMGIPLVVGRDSLYLRPEDAEAWKILVCIKRGITIEEFERESPYEFDASLCSVEEIEKRFVDVPDALENTRRIADRCRLNLTFGAWNFAKVEIPPGLTPDGWLRQRAQKEITNKVSTVTEEMRQRLDHELSVIEKKGFAPYFLIVSDYIEWARRQGIVTTTRGSAAGSLVSFAIGISTINPITFRLPFERFLNPERPSAPDIDADFADNRREELLAYVTEKYGVDKVAQICTFGTMLARAAVRDVGRALGFPYRECDRVAKMIPFGSQGFPMTLDRALEENPELKKLYGENPDVARLIDLARRIEGGARHVSIHAAGVVFAPASLTDFTPLQKDTGEGHILTQYDMKSVEAAGLLKMDFLGIRNLSILGDAIVLTNKLKGMKIVLEEIPLDDQKTFALLARGETMGVFQMGSAGMTRYLMELKPTTIRDIMVMVALYRPGPIESIPEYIKRRHHPETVTYLDPRLKKVLDQSNGVVVYQDDVLLIAIELGGYSWLEVDKLRKAMGKKIPEEMAAQKDKLIKGFIEHGRLSPTLAQKLWKLIEPFAAYGFNKSHAASYGLVAYQTAFMKANFPAIYMTALMTAESADIETISEAVTECERLGIDILPPDINESRKNFTYLDDSHIRFGLLAIKNLGAEVVEVLVAEREVSGPFRDLTDFATRLPHRVFNRKALESLIKVGALDRFGERRNLLDNLEVILNFNKQSEEARRQCQSSLFDLSADLGDSSLRLRPTPPANRLELLAWERELLGLYVSSHPTEQFLELPEESLGRCASAARWSDGDLIRLAVTVNALKIIYTKRQEAMAFVTVEDATSSCEIVVFPRHLREYGEILTEEAILLVSCLVSKRDGETKGLFQSAIPITSENTGALFEMLRTGHWIAQETAKELTEVEPRPSVEKCVEIILRGKPSPEMIRDLREALASVPGHRRVNLLFESAGRTTRLATEYAITDDPAALAAVGRVVGIDNVHVA